MAEIICKQCGFPNPEGSVRCGICDEPLVQENVQKEAVIVPDSTPASASNGPTGEGYQYFVLCPESQTKTVVAGPNVVSFFCEGCKREHIVDDIIWQIERGEAIVASASTAPQKTDKCGLKLEELTTHYVIEVAQTGGTLGRYGKYGAEFFQSRGMLTVSGEHCAIYSDEYGNWVLRHISRTNSTKYEDRVLGANEPVILENGKMLTLANTVTFVVRIG